MSKKNPALGDRVRIDDPSVPRKHGKTGTLARIPDEDIPVEGDNRWAVTIDGGDTYFTRFKHELVWISTAGHAGDNTVDEDLAEETRETRREEGQRLLAVLAATGIDADHRKVAGVLQHKEIASRSGGRRDWAVIASSAEIAAGGFIPVGPEDPLYDQVGQAAAAAFTLVYS